MWISARRRSRLEGGKYADRLTSSAARTAISIVLIVAVVALGRPIR
jgi:hypothetical protein